MLQSIKKFFIKGTVLAVSAAVLGMIPSFTSNADQGALGESGISSLLSVLGNSYDKKTVDSDVMGIVVDQAAELEIDFDISLYEEEYANFAIAKVNDFVNVRAESNTTSGIVGHMYDGAVCEIIERTEEADGVWFKVVSGNVEGYVRSDYFTYGDEALEVIEDYVKKVAVVQCNALNVRSEASTDSAVVGTVTAGDKLELSEEEDFKALKAAENKEEKIDEETTDEETADENTANEDGVSEDEDSSDAEPEEGTEAGEDSEDSDTEDPEELKWVKVKFTSEKEGYVALNYVVIEESYVTAKTIEEEIAEAEAKRKAEEARRAAAAAAVKEDTTIVGSAVTYSSNAELRSSIVEFAKQYVGMRYVMGGQSLSGGTDCSGFTCYVLANFGYSVGRTPSSQFSSAGRAVSLDQAQPGDIICFGDGGCSHVALYIGDGQIVHEANSRLGCVISSINFMNIVGVKNVID